MAGEQPSEALRAILRVAGVADAIVCQFEEPHLNVLWDEYLRTPEQLSAAARTGALSRLKLPEGLKAPLEVTFGPSDIQQAQGVAGQGQAQILTDIRASIQEVVESQKSLVAIAQDRLSATVPASRINQDKLGDLRSAMRVVYLPVLGHHELEALLGPALDPNSAEFDWDGGYNATEEQQHAKYAKHIQDRVKELLGTSLSRDLEWRDVRKYRLKLQVPSMPYAVSCKNDEVLIVRACHNCPELGAVLGVELKKKLTLQALRQAETEYYLWQEKSMYPFCQIVTDLITGAVAFYAEGGKDGKTKLRSRVMIGMDQVWGFIADLMKMLPTTIADITREGQPNDLMPPPELEGPRRVKPRLGHLEQGGDTAMKLLYEMRKPPDVGFVDDIVLSDWGIYA